MATIRVRLFAGLREAAGRPFVTVELEDPATVGALREGLSTALPGAEVRRTSTLIAVNGHYARDGDPLRAGDEVAAFPPVAGG